jgi:hypothetical protein
MIQQQQWSPIYKRTTAINIDKDGIESRQKASCEDVGHQEADISRK